MRKWFLIEILEADKPGICLLHNVGAAWEHENKFADRRIVLAFAAIQKKIHE